MRNTMDDPDLWPEKAMERLEELDDSDGVGMFAQLLRRVAPRGPLDLMDVLNWAQARIRLMAIVEASLKPQDAVDQADAAAAAFEHAADEEAAMFEALRKVTQPE